MSAKKRAYEACPETCPDVQSALDDAFKAIKKYGTEKLRDALIEAYEEIEVLEEKVSSLEEALDKTERQRDSLEDENRSLAAEVVSLEAVQP